ncbi:cytochrome C [Alloacidobacterium dinghuense]|uniref:Cytochrome C n=1 Tax=Alloacidobacterium dinghuense TaxID=2763107 RepID=A0A7G8BK37_9BACT|nr:cytochrome c peroxidase [Alloacidobacterium dinghuense]QNI32907.1 cytochrome C [Alloacidobacterium dinghuense]
MGTRLVSGVLTALALSTPLTSASDQPQSTTAAGPSNLAGKMPPSFDQEVARVVAALDKIEADTLSQVEHTQLDRQAQVRTLGKLLLFDKHLSVNQNEACSFCHTPETGFTGPIQALNQTTVSYPGSVRTRFSNRKPQSYMYAPFAPVLHYNALQGDFVGGNFWDMRASGYRLQNPSAEQAQGPPTNPVEMGLPDSACLAYRISQAPYRKLFETVWGEDSFTIQWPPNVEKICATPGPPPATDEYPVHLSAADRARSDRVYDSFGLAVSAYEFSPEVSPFTSKYDAVQAGKDQFTPQEKLGYELFRGKARCNECHRDGGPGEEPLFTDFTASNLGVPRNPGLQYYYEGAPDQHGYSANPSGNDYVDAGVGHFLRKLKSLSGQLNPDSGWIELAPHFDGKFQVPTLRNVDMRPTPDFVKAYMHNGYFKNLKEVVHFYNTRDVLPRCAPNDPGEKITCWPAPEDSTNLNKRQLGNLKLTDQEEDALVAFLKTLTDDYKIPNQTAAK